MRPQPFDFVSSVATSHGRPLGTDVVLGALLASGWSRAQLQVPHPSRSEVTVLAAAGHDVRVAVVASNDQLPGALSAAYSATAPYALQWSQEELVLHETVRWRASPGDSPLMAASLDDRVGMLELLAMLGPDSEPTNGNTRIVRHAALPDLLAEAFARLRATLLQEQLWHLRHNGAEADLTLVRLFHQLLFVRTTEDRHRDSERPRLDALHGTNDPRQGLASLLELYAEEFDSELFGSVAFQASELPLQQTRDVVRALVEPWKDLRLDFSLAPNDLGGRLYESYLARQPVAAAEVDSSGQQALFGRASSQDRRYVSGVYYTPHALAEIVAQRSLGRWLHDHAPEGWEDIRILDPACGSGSFLVAAYSLLLEYFGTRRGRALTQADRRDLLSHCIFGADRDRSALLLAQVRLLEEADLHEGQLPQLAGNLLHGDSLLAPPSVGEPQHALIPLDVPAIDWSALLHRVGRFSAVLMNPPFAAQISYARLADAKERRALRAAWPQSAEWGADLAGYFVDLALQLLSSTGTAGFVLPRTTVAGEASRVRQMLLGHGVRSLVDCRGASLFPTAKAYVMLIALDSGEEHVLVDEVADSRSPMSTILDALRSAAASEAAELTVGSAQELGSAQGPRESTTPVLRRFQVSQQRLADGPWTAGRLRWDSYSRDLGVDWRPLFDAAEMLLVVPGTQTGRNEAWTVEENLPVDGDALLVDDVPVPVRGVPRLVRGRDIHPFRHQASGSRLLLPTTRLGLSNEHLDRLAGLRGGVPEHVQEGQLEQLLRPKALLRTLAREPSTCPDHDGDRVVVKGTGGAFGLVPQASPDAVGRLGTRTTVDATVALLNSGIYQWILRGLGSVKHDDSVEVSLAQVKQLPWPHLDDDGWEVLAESARTMYATLALEQPVDRTMAYWKARRDADALVDEVLKIQPRLRRTVRAELVRPA